MSSRSKIRVFGAVVLAVPLVLGTASPALAVTPPAGVYADSYGLLVDLTAVAGNVPVNIGPRAAAASSCPTVGGTKTAEELGVGDPAAARADLIAQTATADCALKSGTATSRIVNVDALKGSVNIHADAVTATSNTTCATPPKGSTKILGLSIAGNAVPVPDLVPPNTTVADPLLTALGLRVILNEQHPAAAGRGLVVNGVHVIASGNGATIPVGGTVLRGDVVIAHAVSTVVCPGGPGSDNGGLPKPDISFFKSASPSVATAGQTVTYTALVTNQSTAACEVMKFIEHVAPAFDPAATSGPFGTKFDKANRTDGGVDMVLKPTNLTIGAGKTVTQTFQVTVKDAAVPGTYYDSLEIYCGLNGNFVSGPMAPVTVPGGSVPNLPPENPVVAPPTVGPPVFAHTGLNSSVAATALLLMLAAAGTRRLQLSRR